MTLGVCLLIVLYELFKIVNMKNYIETIVEGRKVKGDLNATTEIFNRNTISKTLMYSELIYFAFLIYLLFTELVWLSVLIVTLAILSRLFSKNNDDAIRFTPYVDSCLNILIVLVMYGVLS